MDKTILQVEGNVNDLLSVDNERNVKMTRFVVDDNCDPENEEIVDIVVTSVDPSRTHRVFNEGLLNKKVKITVEEIE
jgi:hypothetical protein